MKNKDILHNLKIVEIGKSKDLPKNIINELENNDLIELVYSENKPMFNGNHVLTNQGFALLY